MAVEEPSLSKVKRGEVVSGGDHCSGMTEVLQKLLLHLCFFLCFVKQEELHMWCKIFYLQDVFQCFLSLNKLIFYRRWFVSV